MSTLKQQLKADVVAHMKDGNKVALATVRNVLGEIETREKSGKAPVELDDLQVTSLLQKEAARRRETAAIYTEAGETARAEAEIAEAQVVETYLPQPLSEAEAEGIVQDVIAELEAAGEPLTLRQMGQAMKSITPRIAGRFDGKAVSDMVRRRLSGQ
ncbi:GatB/YqeY domain-containing protein [Arthrobacter sp.]|uniref:GatB/YqeY domain-containing protein n=1 Tax=Arthrobacter sp. TaxID=1667 RepID=UPI00258ADCFA|nr:GatB/YqeY domain-containing protein [Arthrobacter sp.]